MGQQRGAASGAEEGPAHAPANRSVERAGGVGARRMWSAGSAPQQEWDMNRKRWGGREGGTVWCQWCRHASVSAEGRERCWYTRGTGQLGAGARAAAAGAVCELQRAANRLLQPLPAPGCLLQAAAARSCCSCRCVQPVPVLLLLWWFRCRRGSAPRGLPPHPRGPTGTGTRRRRPGAPAPRASPAAQAQPLRGGGAGGGR